MTAPVDSRKSSPPSAPKADPAPSRSSEPTRSTETTKAGAAATPAPVKDTFTGSKTDGAPAKAATPTTPPEIKAAIDKLPPNTIDPQDVTALNERLAKMPEKERAEEVKFLTEHVLDEANPDRGLSTYLEVKAMQDVRPDRISNDTVHTLAQGVAEARSNGAAGSEGVLGKAEALDAAEALMRMSDSDFKLLQPALENAGRGKDGKVVAGADPQAERALILNAVGARMDELITPSAADKALIKAGKPSTPMSEVLGFASDVRGTKRADLINNSTVIDLNGGSGALQQRFTTSCVPTTEQIARAEADPVYALKLHQEAVHSLDANGEIGKEQKTILENDGGVAKTRDPSEPGGVGLGWTADMLDETVGKYTNKTYTDNSVADTPEAREAMLDRIDTKLRDGEDVPIRVGWDGGGGHAQLITDVKGTGDDREFLVTDPWNGETAWISQKDIVAGHTDFLCGTGRITDTFE